MNALVLHGAMEFQYEQRPEPECPPGYVTVRTDAVCICGSDVHAIQGRQPLFSFPRVIGHEVAGTVVRVGREAESLQVGDRVCLMPCISCGTCRACQKGKGNACQHLKLYGVHEDGGLQEYLSAPAVNWLKMPKDASPSEIAMMEPLTIGAHAVAKLNLQPDDRVLVIGAGPIGLSCAVNARSYGARVVLSECSASRRALAKDQFGFEVLDPTDADFEAHVRTITGNDLFDAVVDTTAVKPVMEQDWKWITQGGKIVFVGICGGVLGLEELPFHMKEPTLYITRNSTRQDYERVLSLWRSGSLEPKQFVTHTTTFDRAADVLPKWTAPDSGVFKGVVLFP